LLGSGPPLSTDDASLLGWLTSQQSPPRKLQNYPVARFDFHLISRRGRDLPPGADEFTSFLKSYIAIWAGRAGVL
jgi:hypothetical protein